MELSQSMKPQLLITDAPSCNRLADVHGVCSAEASGSRASLVLPCGKGPPRELTPADTEKQGKGPADIHKHRGSAVCLDEGSDKETENRGD